MVKKVRRWKAGLAYVARRRSLEKRCHESRRDIQAALAGVLMTRPKEVPVFLVSYNNGLYVANMVDQLASYGIKPIILDNASSDDETLEVLNRIQESARGHVIRCRENFGHMVGFLQPNYEVMPEVFAYSDPDLQFSPAMPQDFLDILSALTERFNVYKAGLALPIDPQQRLTEQTKKRSKTYPFVYNEDLTVAEWERQHWRFPLFDEKLKLYAAPVDTTFAVYRKSNYRGDFYDAIRVSGAFDAIHLPWFPEIDIMSKQQKVAYLEGNKATTWVR